MCDGCGHNCFVFIGAWCGCCPSTCCCQCHVDERCCDHTWALNWRWFSRLDLFWCQGWCGGCGRGCRGAWSWRERLQAQCDGLVQVQHIVHTIRCCRCPMWARRCSWWHSRWSLRNWRCCRRTWCRSWRQSRWCLYFNWQCCRCTRRRRCRHGRWCLCNCRGCGRLVHSILLPILIVLDAFGFIKNWNLIVVAGIPFPASCCQCQIAISCLRILHVHGNRCLVPLQTQNIQSRIQGCPTAQLVAKG